MKGKSIGFQNSDQKLAEELQSILDKKEQFPNLMLGIPHGFASTKNDKISVAVFWWSYLVRNYKWLKGHIPNTIQYGDASFSRVVTELRDTGEVSKHISNVKTLWQGRDVIIVEGIQTRFGVGNGLLDNANNILRIEAPAKNAFDVIDELVAATLATRKKLSDPVVLVSLGPTATVMAARLSLFGVQTIDTGHFDLQFEYYRKGETKKVDIPDRYDNETINGQFVTDTQDETYSSQIEIVIRDEEE